MLITVEFGIHALQTFLSWILPALFFLTVYFVLSLSFPNNPISDVLVFVWLALLLLQFIVGLGNKPAAVERFYTFSCHVFGLIQMGVFGLTMYQFYYILQVRTSPRDVVGVRR
jgi:hypothetical protein